MNNTAIEVRRVFCQLLDLESPGQQEQFLETQCADDTEVKLRVQALLRAHRSSDKFLGGAGPTSGTGESADAGPSQEFVGAQIDRYRLIEQIGEGGFGVVYRAEQQEPLRRQVALKLIKPGMDTRQVVARFEHERQALSIMDHPNIARVFDGGATENGRPYFVMELVSGLPVTEYCESGHIGLIDRLKLFQSICEGVQHAHQKGIIHRDLKPSNILVASTLNGPVAKIIDFGVAKVIHELPGERSSLTRGGVLIGTPVYMSPEQTASGPQDIDTRSDIYSLGVVLYELLSGMTPFEKKWIESLGPEQLRRTICEVDPPRPSQRVMQGAAVQQTSGTPSPRNAKKTASLLRGELDWIVMKSLEKERDRRYSSAGALASDISRYLLHEPVRAGPPSTAYRFRKFARRNRVALTVAALMLFGLSAMVVFSTRAARIARDAGSLAQTRLLAEQRAHEEAKKAKEEAQGQRSEAERQRVRAEANLADARAAIDQILQPVLSQSDAENPIPSEVKNALLREALRFYELFLERNASDPELRAETAWASLRVALMHSSLGELEPAEQAARRSVQLWESLTDQFATHSGFAVEMANAKSRLARILRDRNRHLAEAESLSMEVIDIYDRRIVGQPDNEVNMINLANELHELGYLRAFFGNPVSAEAPLTRCVEIEEQLALRNPNNSERVVMLALRMNSLGIFLRQTRRAKEAEIIHRRALALFDEMGRRFSESTNADSRSHQRTRTLTHLAYALELQMDLEESESLIRQTIEYRQPGGEGELSGVYHQRAELALSIVQLAGVLEKQSRLELASEEYQKAIELLDPLRTAMPQMATYQYHYLNTIRRWGNLAMRQDQPDLARQRFEVLGKCQPSSPQAKTTTAWHHCTCPLTGFRDPGRAAELARAATDETPADGKSWAALGAALFRQGLAAESIPVLEKANQILQPAGDNSAAYFLAMAQWQQGLTKTALGHWEGIDASWDAQRLDMFDLQACRKEAATILRIELEAP